MKIPAPPVIPPPPPPVFVGASKKKRDNELGSIIKELFTRLVSITYVPGWREMLYKFRDAIQPGGRMDMTRLPYTASGPKLMKQVGPRYQPIACLYTQLSWIIQCYWRICLHDEGGEEALRWAVHEMTELIAHQDSRGNQYHLQQILLRCNVTGNERDGYELEWRGTL